MNPFHRLQNLRMVNDQRGHDMAEMRPRFDALRTRHEDGTAPQAVSAFQLFQTPAAMAARLVAALGPIPTGSRILEPSAGLGRILDQLPRGVDVVACEIAPQCAGELFKHDRERVTIRQGDFLGMANLGEFDFVAMNPPFHMRADVRHILHALTLLKSGGTLAALCMAGPQREKALRPLAATWEEIPAGTFRSEGTNVPTVLLTIKKQ